jgi:hypothetical protein
MLNGLIYLPKSCKLTGREKYQKESPSQVIQGDSQKRLISHKIAVFAILQKVK